MQINNFAKQQLNLVLWCVCARALNDIDCIQEQRLRDTFAPGNWATTFFLKKMYFAMISSHSARRPIPTIGSTRENIFARLHPPY